MTLASLHVFGNMPKLKDLLIKLERGIIISALIITIHENTIATYTFSTSFYYVTPFTQCHMRYNVSK